MTPLLLLLVAVVVIVLASRRGPVADATPDPRPSPTPDRALPDALLRLPEPARTRAWQLTCSVHDALRDPPADARAAYLLREAAGTYLPDTVDAFLRLTPAARAQLEAQGQPPETLLLEQLTLIEGGVREALRHDHAAADRLLTQGRFLRERFGTPADLTVRER